MNAPVSDFTRIEIGPGVIIERASKRSVSRYPSDGEPTYRVSPLAMSPLTPDARGLFIVVGDSAGSNSAESKPLRFGLHQYGFVVGDRALELTWWSQNKKLTTTISSGDSFYMKPGTRHIFRGSGAGPGPARLFSFRCQGAFGSDAVRELMMQEASVIDRFGALRSAWYD